MKNAPTEIADFHTALKNEAEFPTLTTKVLYAIKKSHNVTYSQVKQHFMSPAQMVKRGVWDVSEIADDNGNVSASRAISLTSAPATPPAANETSQFKLAAGGVSSVVSDEVYIPAVCKTFVPWGEYSTIRKILQSKKFFPVFISGMSGNGKTMMVEQACAKLKREYVRVQISPETDEDDLIGGFRLIDGETVFQKGPVIKAMEAGCVLLVDEIDRGTNKILCLQGILEGKPVLVKKTGEVISPAPGFNIIATANTKGRGSVDGRYVAAQVIDDAFIERFVASIDQPYPSHEVELKIVKRHMEQADVDDVDFVNQLVNWSTVIRKTYEADGVDEVISTRRLCHIVRAYGIFGDCMKSINMCITRFDDETKDAFLDLFTKVSESAAQSAAQSADGQSADGQSSPTASTSMTGKAISPRHQPESWSSPTAPDAALEHTSSTAAPF